MKKTLHTIAVILGVISGLAAVIGPAVVLIRRFKATHAPKEEE